MFTILELIGDLFAIHSQFNILKLDTKIVESCLYQYYIFILYTTKHKKSHSKLITET